MKRKIIECVWKHPAQQGRCVGIVAALTPTGPKDFETWQAYTGIISFPLNEDNDAQIIATVGAKLSAKEAAGFFPQLNIEHYKK